MRSTFRLRAAVATICLLALPAPARPQKAPVGRASSVELDVVVLDKEDRPVRGLQQSDFTVKEDNRPVPVTTFTEVSAAGIDGRADSRVVSLLLDDNSVSLNATTAMQNIARRFLSFARPADIVSAVRLTHREDEAAGGLPAALEAIDAYRAGSLGFFGRTMSEDAMQVVAKAARQLEPIEHKRKVLVCIGSREVCDPYFEVPENSLLWNSWRAGNVETDRRHCSSHHLVRHLRMAWQ
jgi:hypothetical protein